MSTVVVAVRTHPNRYEKDFDTVVAIISKYIDRKAPTKSVKVASIAQTRPAKRQKTSASHSTFREKSELRKDSREEYDSMSAAQCQQLYELWKKAKLIKGKKTPESSRALEARLTTLEAKSKNSGNESLFADINKASLVTEITQPWIEQEMAPDKPCRYLMIRAIKR